MTFKNLEEMDRPVTPIPDSELKTKTASFGDDKWEDVEIEQSSPSSSIRSFSSTPRRRKAAGTRVVYVAAPSYPRKPMATRRLKPRPKADTSELLTETNYHSEGSRPAGFDPSRPAASTRLQEKWLEMEPHVRLRFVLTYLVRVVGGAFWIHRPLFSIALALVMAYLVFTPIVSFTQSLASPMCAVPVLRKAIPFCWWDHSRGRDTKSAKWADYPKLMDIQSSSFEELLDNSVGNSALAFEVKKAEMATSDLATLVRASELRSRDSLAETLVKFVDDARRTSRGLQTLSSKINGAVDTVLAVNDYALNTIEAASAPKSLMFRTLTHFSLSVQESAKKAVTGAFTASMSTLSQVMERCIMEAQVSLANLDRLEEYLSLIHEMVTREDFAVQLEKSEVLSQLWTILGGNKKKLRGIDGHLTLLNGVSGYRKRALAHVVATLQTLSTLSADMEELRSRVAAPDIVGDKIPVEVHIKSIRGGLERLKIGQMRSKERQEETQRRILGS